jgi:bifunctional non-homologous end joining protein LigD
MTHEVLDFHGRPLVVTDPERRLFGDAGPTKAQLLAYYTTVAPRMAPFLRGRAVSTVVLPDESTHEFRFARTAPPGCLGHFPTSRLACLSSLRIERYLIVPDDATLLALVHHGCLSFHPWNSTVRAPLQPTEMVFNLDPEAIAFREVRKAALLLRHLLGRFGLQSSVKTSGRGGLHVVVPVGGDVTFEDTRYAADSIVNRAMMSDPGLFSRDSRRARRRGKILIDTSRNQRGETLIAPYAVATSGLPSAPLEWSELEQPIYPDDFDMDRVVARHSAELAKQATLVGADQSLEPLLRRRRRASATSHPSKTDADSQWLANATPAEVHDQTLWLGERNRRIRDDAEVARIDSVNIRARADKVLEERRLRDA